MGTDGVLRKVTGQTWEGTLGGYRVVVSSAGGWHAAVIHAAKRFTCVCLPAASFADAARRARAWVEAHPIDASSGSRAGS